MNTSLSINRKRLEQYPLFTHPFLRVLMAVANFVVWLFLLFLLSDDSSSLHMTTPLSEVGHSPVDMVLDRPFLAFTLGLIAGAAARYAYRSTYLRGIDPFVDAYFRTLEQHRVEQRGKFDRRVLLMFPLLLFLMYALLFLFWWYGERLLFGFVGFSIGYVVVAVPQYAALHREIVRRRRIAFAWEGVEYPDNRLTGGQKLRVFLVGAGVILYFSGIGYAMHWTAELSNPDYWRGFNLYMKGKEISAPDADKLDAMLAESPDNYDARMMLIGYHTQQTMDSHDAEDHDAERLHADRVRAHALYLVEQIPGHGFTEQALTSMPWGTDEPRYLEFADLWRAQVKRNPDDPDVYWNAARFFYGKDDDYRRLLLQRGRVLEPKDDRWWDELSLHILDGLH